ncbi:NUDIX hydrolase [Ahrensia sp. 13_GOM-1096m]|uniref:NUDIX hydrolase n=1 Tax=Ahrensia sp. 13_GOM-1096m TaxID=1380380 RepID=UPI0004787CE4|nr:NUDIX hydrolase [Ahrensia sp. 13_GOM-1096m]
MSDKKKDHRVGIIPFSVRGDLIAVLFVTSHTRGRWILPKGRSKKGETDNEASLREAFEEAGIKGKVLTDFPMTVMIDKSIGDGTTERVPVTYYPMYVRKQVDEFPEKESRERHWALLDDAPRVAYHDDYLEVIKQFKRLAPKIKEAAKANK